MVPAAAAVPFVTATVSAVPAVSRMFETPMSRTRFPAGGSQTAAMVVESAVGASALTCVRRSLLAILRLLGCCFLCLLDRFVRGLLSANDIECSTYNQRN